MADLDHEKTVEDTKLLLESVALLETVAAEREAKAEKLMASLTDAGMEPEEMADELDISKSSAHRLLDREEPKPPHDRIGISEESVQKLDPYALRSTENRNVS